MPTTSIARPGSTEYAPFYGGYVAAVPDTDLLQLLEQQARDTVALLSSISEERSLHRYGAGKWSIREVLGHVIDGERVFTYRALTFARSDAGPLPSFDENAWASASNAHERTMRELLDEYGAVRTATIALFRGFREEDFARSGTASNNPITVRALAYIVAGHERHHVKILRERYLS